MAFDQYESLFRALPSPYMVLDTELRYVAANEAYAKATNTTIQELLGRKIFDLFPNDGESGRRLRDSFMRVIESGKPDTLAHIRYAIPRSDGSGFDDRYWTAVHLPLFNEDGYVAHIVQNTVDVTELHALRRNSFLPSFSSPVESALIRRAREAEEVHRALLEENKNFRRLFNQAPGMVAVLSGPNHVFTFTNEEYSRFIGSRRVVGKPVRKALPDLEGQGFFEMLDQVYETGKPVSMKGARVLLEQPHGNGPAEHHMDFTYHPIFDAGGNVNGIFVQGLDRTEAVRAEHARDLMMRELNHRVKNLFTVAISMVNMTARNVASPSEMAEILVGRLSALSHAHGMVMHESGSPAEESRIGIEDLIRKILAPHSGDDENRFACEGPFVSLGSKAATSVALVIHELATNAAKYGALSSPDGAIDIGWSCEDGTIHLIWKETGGPRIAGTPEPSGFGSRLARISVEGQLGGSLGFEWPPEGVVVTIRFPEAAATQ